MELYDLIISAKENDEEAILTILEKFKPKLKKSLKQVPLQEQEDLLQELTLKIIEVINHFNLEDNERFNDFVQNYKKINE